MRFATACFASHFHSPENVFLDFAPTIPTVRVHLDHRYIHHPHIRADFGKENDVDDNRKQGEVCTCSSRLLIRWR